MSSSFLSAAAARTATQPNAGAPQPDAGAETIPTNHQGGPPLYGRMMKAIATGHTFGNRVRMVKLPLIFVEDKLYAGAICQFFWLTETLEVSLAKHADHPMVARLKSLGLGSLAPGYSADLEEMLGAHWRAEAAAMRTAPTEAYWCGPRAANANPHNCRSSCSEILATSGPVELVAAAFILYGALVVGGGKITQQKVKKICEPYRAAIPLNLASCVCTIPVGVAARTPPSV
eukprot:6203793-Prymnesium_polylepis.3